MESVKLKLKLLYDLLVDINSPIIPLLQDGLTVEYIDKINKFPYKIPREVYELFCWKNGVALEDEFFLGHTWIFPGGGFFPIENSIERYEYYAGKDGYWRSSMFQIFESGGGEMYLLECDPNRGDYGMIFKHSIGDIEYDVIISIYDSLNSFLDTLIRCYKEDAYVMNPLRGVSLPDEEHYSKMKEIAGSLNIRSEFWKLW